MSSHYRQQLEAWLKTVDVSADTVVDVGGAQLPVKDRVRSWQVREYRIADLPTPHKVAAGTDMVLNLNLNQKHLELADSPDADIVFCLEVMEYVYDPAQAVQNLWRLTKKDGILYITFPHYYPPHEPYEEDCLRYTLSGVRRLMEGWFEIEEVVHRTCRGVYLTEVVGANALRPSKQASADEVNSMGFIIKAKRI